ncbi:aminopeptidase N-like [Pogonomyrmex barbatus]|uniref:Aminopeptidase N-like n=1 Tax=Pogonomyrmex barbatus TaxID=144034 RepID=A0A6I9WA92_9HYME|nr:aminopeptidase N-like [Pogonomyrmex barbatus]
MELLKLFLNISLIFVVKAATDNDSMNNLYSEICMHSTNRQLIKPFDNHIELMLFIENFINVISPDTYKSYKSYIDEQQAKNNSVFYGIFTSRFGVSNKTNIIRLNVLNLKIDETKTKVISLTNFKVIEPKTYTYDNKTQTVVITFVDDFLPLNIYRLKINFIGTMIHTNKHWRRNLNKVWLITPGFYGTETRQMFPYWDKLDIKSNFSITIWYHGNYKAISNTEIKVIYEENDKKIIDFNTVVNISSHLVAVVLVNLHNITDEFYDADENQIFNIWGRRKIVPFLETMSSVIIDSINNLRNSLSKTQLSPNMNFVIIPGFLDENVESRGLILYNEADVVYDDELYSFAHNITMACTVARKIAHQFFGNTIGRAWGSDLWINEGIATFLAMKIVNEILPDSKILDLFVVQFQHEALRLNDYYDMPLVSKVNESSEINSIFPFTYYVKAPVFIRMLSQIISKNVFMLGLSRYISLYQDKSYIYTSNCAFDEFLNTIQQIQKTMYKNRPTDYKTKLDSWLTQKRYPVLHVTQSYINNTIELQKDVNESYPKNLWIPVTYITQNSHDYNKPLPKHWLTPHEPILYETDIESKHWIVVNVQQAGFYRVKYDTKSWENILKYLHSSQFYNIHHLNRAQLIDDAYYFLSKGELDFNFFKKLTFYLTNDNNYISWYPLIKIMEQLSGFFPFPESTEVKKHFRTILKDLLKFIGYVESDADFDVTMNLRQEAAKWECILGSFTCKIVATVQLFSDLDAKHNFVSEHDRIWPWWKEWTYCNGLKRANYTIWIDVFNLAEPEKEMERILDFLACSEKYNIITDYINRLKHLNKRKYIIAFHSIIARQSKNNDVLDYILKNFVRLIRRKINKIAIIANIINYVYSKEQLDKISNFVNNSGFFYDTSYINQKIKTRLSEINKQVDYFKRFL